MDREMIAELLTQDIFTGEKRLLTSIGIITCAVAREFQGSVTGVRSRCVERREQFACSNDIEVSLAHSCRATLYWMRMR